jgi:integrase
MYKQDVRLVGNLTNEIKVHSHVIVGFPNHEARVFETPLNIGNDELRLRCCLRSVPMKLDRNRQVVRGAEQGEHSAHLRLSSIRTVEVEEWLHSLTLAPSSKAKLKCALSVLYNHAIRYQWLTFNPISRVRTLQKRLRDKDVLTPDEFQQLVQQLSVRDRAMVLLIGSTGLRRSEMIALTWSALNLITMEVNVLRSCVRNRIGKTKTEASRRPVPLHPVILSVLLEWRVQSPYATDLDFLFPLGLVQRKQTPQS